MITSLLILILLTPPPTQKVSLHIAAPMNDGFVDTNKGIQDSIKDIRNRLAKDKRIVIVNDPSRADLVLTVVARGIRYERTGQTEVTTSYFESESSTRVETTTQDIYSSGMWVKTVMTFGRMEREVNGGYNNEPGGWGACATQIAEDVRSWIAANASRIVQLRTARR